MHHAAAVSTRVREESVVAAPLPKISSPRGVPVVSRRSWWRQDEPSSRAHAPGGRAGGRQVAQHGENDRAEARDTTGGKSASHYGDAGVLCSF